MQQFNFVGLSADQLRAIAAEANRLADIGILPSDPELQPLADLINELAASRKISNAQVVHSLAEALEIKLENKTTEKNGARKQSLRDAMKAGLDGKYSNSTSTEQIASDYIDQHGEAAFCALKTQYPLPKGFTM